MKTSVSVPIKTVESLYWFMRSLRHPQHAAVRVTFVDERIELDLLTDKRDYVASANSALVRHMTPKFSRFKMITPQHFYQRVNQIAQLVAN